LPKVKGRFVMAAIPSVIERERSTWLFVCAALVALVLVFLGFSRTYYLKNFFDGPPLSGAVHFHGAIMSLWFVLFATQATLIRARHVRWHRRLGVAGIGLALLVVITGTYVAIASAARGGGPPGLPPLQFLVIPLGDMLVFSILAGAAIGLRKRRDWHKRLMLLASLALLAAAIARIPLAGINQGGPLVFFGLTNLVLLACVIYDTAVNRRLHPAFGWGLALIVASQVGRLMVSGTDWWLSFAQWLTGQA
jgi:uncharacterized membrane protein YozB (DUF420 family)